MLLLLLEDDETDHETCAEEDCWQTLKNKGIGPFGS